MSSRMDRYSSRNPKENYSRSNRNKELYQNIATNTRYANIEDIATSNAIDLDKASQNTMTREGYHHMREFKEVVEKPKEKKKLEDFNYLYHNHENRIYDINQVLEEAHKNRQDIDEKEQKRKLKSIYNITSLDPKELEKYREERKNRVYNTEEKEIRDIIDTIASKTLAGEIDKATTIDLLSDLMATNALDVIPPIENEESDESDNDSSKSKEILDKNQLEEIKKVDLEKNKKDDSKIKGVDTDFYTRSMDLSDEDFDMDDCFKEKKVSKGVKILLILILISVLSIAGYFIWKTFC